MVAQLEVTTVDLQTFMGTPAIDDNRAQMIIDAVIAQCESIVFPLTAASIGVVLTAASRAYASPPGGITSELVGPYQATRPSSGIYLTKGERAALRRTSGKGGAFVIDPTPADAGPFNSWAQVAYSSLDAADSVSEFDSNPGV